MNRRVSPKMANRIQTVATIIILALLAFVFGSMRLEDALSQSSRRRSRRLTPIRVDSAWRRRLQAARKKVPQIEGMVYIPAGDFIMGTNRGQEEEAKPAHKVYLDAFYIDVNEVTNARYEKFMIATRRRPPRYWNDERLNKPDHPVVGVSWNDAGAYARWAKKRLPTEAEWEKAARGTDGRKWPWGNAWDKTKCNSSESQLNATAPIGSFKDDLSPYGCRDMAGNVSEWVSDWFGKDYYVNDYVKNPKGPKKGGYRVLRGSSWLDYFDAIADCTARARITPISRLIDAGFRCAKSAK